MFVEIKNGGGAGIEIIVSCLFVCSSIKFKFMQSIHTNIIIKKQLKIFRAGKIGTYEKK